MYISNPVQPVCINTKINTLSEPVSYVLLLREMHWFTSRRKREVVKGGERKRRVRTYTAALIHANDLQHDGSAGTVNYATLTTGILWSDTWGDHLYHGVTLTLYNKPRGSGFRASLSGNHCWGHKKTEEPEKQLSNNNVMKYISYNGTTEAVWTFQPLLHSNPLTFLQSSACFYVQTKWMLHVNVWRNEV